MRSVHLLILAATLIVMTGCAKVEVTPTLDSSLGYDAYASMGKIDVRPVPIAVYFDKKLLEATSQQTIKMGAFKFELGKPLAVKMIKGLACQFRTVYVADTPDVQDVYPVKALMRVQLQDMDTKMDVKTGWSTVSAESYTRLAIRAEIVDLQEKRVVWVGTSQVSQTGGVQEAILTYQEAGRGFAKGFDGAIDRAVGDIFSQMNRSQSLANYFASQS